MVARDFSLPPEQKADAAATTAATTAAAAFVPFWVQAVHVGLRKTLSEAVGNLPSKAAKQAKGLREVQDPAPHPHPGCCHSRISKNVVLV